MLHPLLRLDPSDYNLFISLPCVSFCLYYLFCVHGWRCGPLPPLDSLPRPVLCTWIGGAAPCPLDSLPRPVHHILYHRIHVSLSVLAICLVYIDRRRSPLPLDSLAGCVVSCPLDYLPRRTWPHIFGATRLFRHKPVLEEEQKGI